MATQIFISLIVSTIGAAYFIYGKKQDELYFMLAGGLLCIYTYFISDPVLSTATGAILMAVPFFTRYLGW